MVTLIRKFLTITLLIIVNQSIAQEIWKESFDIPEKGVWGSDDADYIKTDFEGILTWTLDYSNAFPVDSEDYAKTVSTSGGRFECRDIDGEVIWYSEDIDISDYKNVRIELISRETGSGANEATKFLKAFYKLDNGPETLLGTNGENYGNWGLNTASQSDLSGDKLQIVVRMSNFYSADKVILDEVTVAADITYELARPGDVILNEILFNPVPDGSDYIEIVNVSEKLLSLKNLFLASRDNDFKLTQVYPVSEVDFPFEPNEYLVLTKDTNGVFPWFYIECETCFRQMAKFPSFNNDEDIVVLLNEQMEIIDEFHYTEEMHSPFFYDVEGVSLERLSMETATNTSGNWFSASSEAGHGTPGYENSQKGAENIAQPKITFEPDAFSPNLDGYNDEYHIHYELSQPGYLANAWIFDAAGRLVLQLANNEILSASGEISWNGENETGQKQPIGVYVVAVEFFNSEGDIYRYKDGVVLTGILE